MKLNFCRPMIAVLLLAGCGGKGGEDEHPDNPATKPATAEDLIAEREQLDRSVWADEVAAQRYESAFVRLWDRLRAAQDKAAALKLFAFDELVIGEMAAEDGESLGRGILRHQFSEPSRTLTREQFSTEVDRLAAAGFSIIQSEWHHAHFEPSGGENGAPRSTIRAVLHLANLGARQLVIANVTLLVDWSDQTDEHGEPIAREVEASEVELLSRVGAPPFQELARITPAAPGGGHVLSDPILAYDLDGDGLSEIVIGGRNLVLRNKGGGKFVGEEFIPELPAIFESAVLADFDGDARADFLCVGRDGALRVYRGEWGGRISSAPLVCNAVNLPNPMVLTAGDIDHDGDLDVWVGQYKPPYAGGHMPTPYFNANDGLPAYLLENDGRGNFRDVTKGSSLEAKRYRRTYAASMVDLDDDGHLDLLVTSDFAGIDLYRGDGKGGFADVTDVWVEGGHNFGMSHTFGDYDRDGRLDFYVVGMSSTTARRLDKMGLVRDDRPEIHRMRGKMGYGNRMYLARDNGRFVEPEFRDAVARSGWSWGSTSFDLENDGDLDIYIANGHQSGKTARDYCTKFWRHDIYTGSSRPDLEVGKVFRDELGLLGRGEVSWNGFEHNALLIDRGGGDGFVNVAFLMGVAYEFDARAVVSDDLDADGRVDLLVVGNARNESGQLVQTLYLLANRSEPTGNWIGVRLREEGAGKSPIGAKVWLVTAEGKRVAAAIVCGDSLYAQHAPVVHFGLGATTEVKALEVRWSDGTLRKIENPQPNRYHDVRALD